MIWSSCFRSLNLKNVCLLFEKNRIDSNTIDILIFGQNTDDEEENKKYLRLNMIVKYTDKVIENDGSNLLWINKIIRIYFDFFKYPDEIPKFEFKNVKVLTDEDVIIMREKAKDLAAKNQGNQMLYEIIEVRNTRFDSHIFWFIYHFIYLFLCQ